MTDRSQSAPDSEVTTATTRVAAVELASQSGMFALKTMALGFARTLDAQVSDTAAPLGPYHGYRAQVLEEAALECEDTKIEASTTGGDLFNNACDICAKDIRALKNADPQVASGQSTASETGPVVAAPNRAEGEIKCSRCGQVGSEWSGCQDPLGPAEYEQEQHG